MRIVFLLQASSAVLKGGAEIQADYIIGEVLKHGHEIFFISDLIREESSPRIEGVKYIFLKSFGTKYSYRNARPLLRALKSCDPDIIYNRWRIPYTGIAAWYTRKYGKKLIFSIASAKDVLKNRISLNRTFSSNWISEHLGRYGLRRADVIITQNHDQQEALRRCFHLRSVLIPQGHPVPSGPFPKPAVPAVIWVANIKPVKQLEVFLELAKALKGVEARFIYVGRPDSGRYQEKIDRATQSLANVTAAGELSHNETNNLIASSSILVNTSLHEGSPNTFIQAWMREIPVVSLNVNPDNILNEKKIGFCSGTFDRLVEDVRFLLEHEEERVAQGRRAREYAIEHHDIAVVGKKYLGLFEGLIRRGGDGHASKQGNPK